MTQKTINLGTADQGNGDPIRVAFGKVNDNFTELYTALGLNVGGLNLGAFEFTGSTMSTTDSSAIVIDQAVSVTSDLTVGGDIVPNIANGGDLGSLAKPFKSLYVSNNTIYFGNVPLSLDANNNLTVNGSQVAGASLTGWTVDLNNHFLPNTDILQDIGTPANRVRHIYVGPGSITIGSSVITESTTGKLVLPGITRGVNYTIDEVEEKGDQDYEFDETPLVIDAAYYDILRGVLNTPQGYQPPEYAVDDMDDGEIDGISVVDGGAGLDQTVANKMRERMRAYVGNNQDPINNFVANDWIVIPFTVSTEAADIEYETSGDRLVNGVHEVVLGANGTLTVADDIILPQTGRIIKDCNNSGGTTSMRWINIPVDQEVQLIRAYTGDPDDEDDVERAKISVEWQTPDQSGLSITAFDDGLGKTWDFKGNGSLTLPAGGDIINSSGQSVLGGGSYTPDDSDNWNSPTVNTVAAALDELAAKVAALENFEIDGGNAYTPAAGELIIDGNGA